MSVWKDFDRAKLTSIQYAQKEVIGNIDEYIGIKEYEGTMENAGYMYIYHCQFKGDVTVSYRVVELPVVS
jgi:hypothetical protein